MDFDRLQRIFGRMLETHGMLFAAALAAVIVLLLLVFLARRRKNKPKQDAKMAKGKKHQNQDGTADAGGVTTIDGTTDLIIDDDVSMTLQLDDGDDEIDMSQMSDDAAMLDMGAGEAAAPDQLDAALAEEFGHLDDDQNATQTTMTDLDDITIPKVGEAPPPQKSRFFSASWLGRDKGAKTGGSVSDPNLTTDITFTAEDSKTRASAAECARLAEIERKMLALRELYDAGLIAPEIYVLKARELSHQV